MLGRVDPQIAELEKLRKAAERARSPFDREAWLNLAFFLNHQYVEWNSEANNLRQIRRAPGMENAPRPIVNKIQHFIQTERAMVMQAKPTFDVLPATDDLMDISDASVSKAYLTMLAEPVNVNFEKQLSRAALWALVTPAGWLKWVWNPLEKHPDCLPCSFFEVFVDPYARDFDRARYVIHSQFMDVEQVYEAYGKRVKAGEVDQADMDRAALLRGMGSAPVVSGVQVHELWEKPLRSNEYRGRYAVWTSREFLVPPKDHPYEHKRIPFTQIGCLERPDSLYYMSPVTYLRPAQMEFNKLLAQRITNREAFANYKWWIDSAIQMENMPTDKPREILRGDGGPQVLRPEIIAPPALPDNGDLQTIEQQMMHIVGQHEVSQAQVPGRVEAAKAIEMLKESDADRLSTMLSTISAAISIGGYQWLMLAKQFVDKDVIVQSYSREGMPEVQRFKKESVKDGMRVVVPMGTGLARSRAARQDQLLNWWQNQIITDPAQMAELMEIPVSSFDPHRARDTRLAKNENITLADGKAITPNSWDDHAIHLREHNDYRKTQEYIMLDEDAKTRFEAHCSMHETMQVQQLQRQAMLAAIAQGQPAGPPPGPQPTDQPTDQPQEAPPA